MAAERNVNANNLVQDIVQHPAFRETINSILTVANQEQSCLLLRLKSPSMRGASKIDLLWATAWLLVTRVRLIYLVDEYFCWCKLREFGGRRSPRFLSVTPVAESFSSNLLGAIIRPQNYNKLLGMVAFRILSSNLSNIHDRALLQK